MSADDADDESGAAESGAAEFVVGILSTPNLPTRLAYALKDLLPAALAAQLRDDVPWRVEVIDDPFESMFPDDSRLLDKAAARVRETEWDVALCLTDLPLRGDRGEVVLADLRPHRRIGLVSIPALGGFRLQHRLQRLAIPAVDHLLRGDGGDGPGTSTTLPLGRVAGSSVRHKEDGELGVVQGRRSGTVRLLTGMTRANRPWRLVIGLSTAMAGSLAGIAFGLLYYSVWTLATAMGPVRLLGLALVAVILLIVWIIVHHNLWEPRRNRTAVPGLELRLRNAGTVSTVTVGALIFCLALFAVAFAGAVLIIPPDYLAGTLGRPVHITDYATVALMASILGTIAGAVGSGLEDDETVRNATYGHRGQERLLRVQRQREQT